MQTLKHRTANKQAVPGRRQFLGAAASASLLALGPRVHAVCGSQVEKIRVGVVGFGGRGRNLIDAIRACQDMRLVAVCDVDQQVLHGFEPGNGELIRAGRLAELLVRDDIDAIASATPNHWHTLLTMRACAAGKHVYIEKPISHDMHESRAVVAAARKFDRIVQCGFQNRSDSALRPFFQRLHAGDFGRVLSVHGTCHRARDPIGKLDQPLSIPESVDYQEWLGPAEDLPIYRPRLHYDWHWVFNTGNGDVGNQGPHEWDLMNWALGDPESLPISMRSAGGRFGWDDAGETPNVMLCQGSSAGGIPVSFEVMDLRDGGSPPRGVGVGIIVQTEAGYFAGGRGGGRFVFADGQELTFARDPAEAGGDGTLAHMQNFADAIRAGDRALLRSECAVAANSSAMAHMANLSCRLGSAVEPDEVAAALPGEPAARLLEAPALFAAKHEFRGTATWTLGPALAFDPSRKQFTGEHASAANPLMSRKCRAGYELPEA